MGIIPLVYSWFIVQKDFPTLRSRISHENWQLSLLACLRTRLERHSSNSAIETDNLWQQREILQIDMLLRFVPYAPVLQLDLYNN